MADGIVYLVGAGPGDPELLTLKGRRVLETADAVLFDHLASEALLAFAPATAERLYVGKKKADHALAQDEITQALIVRARQGKRVFAGEGCGLVLRGRPVDDPGSSNDSFMYPPARSSRLDLYLYHK